MTRELDGGPVGQGGGAPPVFGTGYKFAGSTVPVVTDAAPPGLSLLAFGTAMDPIIFEPGSWVSFTSWFMAPAAAGHQTWVNLSINGAPTPAPEVEALGVAGGSASRVVKVTLTFPVATPLWFDLRVGKSGGPAGTITYTNGELTFWRVS